MRVAITGATGFVGQHILQRTLRDGHQVTALYRQNHPRIDGITWVRGNLGQEQALRELTANAETVIHCAAQLRGLSYPEFASVNVEGLRRLLNAMNAASQRLLLVSSLAAREPQLSHYARSKQEAEALLQNSAAANWTIFRPPAVYGPGDRELLPLLKMIGRGWAPIPATFSNRLSLLYAPDLAGAVGCWLGNPEAGTGRIYELGDGNAEGYSWEDLLSITDRLCGFRARRLRLPRKSLSIIALINEAAARIFRYSPMFTRGKVNEVSHPDWICDNEAIRTDIGWQPKFSLEEGLQNTPGWLRASS